jgi:hypothetical protein
LRGRTIKCVSGHFHDAHGIFFSSSLHRILQVVKNYTAEIKFA